MAVRDLVQARRHAEAVQAIDRVLEGDADRIAVDFLLYLKARSQVALERFDPARATLAELERRFPKSRWGDRARFLRADVLVRQRNYEEAGAIYQAEAARLLSEGRKDELASIYLEFADRYFEGVPADDPGGKKKPDYKRALVYYRQALTLSPSLMQRNLNRITAISLAGIKPYHELSLELGDGRDDADRKRSLELPLKDEGAYLIVCRGENQYASGLVLVSPLKLEVQEDAASGRVRVTVRDAVEESYVPDVEVKVIGSSNKDFISGETDLRGLFVADAIRGTGTVIARAEGNRYAFYRGKTVLGPPQTKAPAQKSGETPPDASAAPDKANAKDALLRNLRGGNSAIQQQQREHYKNLLQNKGKGVKAKGAF